MAIIKGYFHQQNKLLLLYILEDPFIVTSFIQFISYKIISKCLMIISPLASFCSLLLTCLLVCNIIQNPDILTFIQPYVLSGGLLLESYLSTSTNFVEASQYILANPSIIKLITTLFSVSNASFSSEFTLFYTPTLQELFSAVMCLLYQLFLYILQSLNISIFSLSFTGLFIGGSGLYLQLFQHIQVYWYQSTSQIIHSSIQDLCVFSSLHQVSNAFYLLYTMLSMSLEICQRILQLFIPSFSFQNITKHLYKRCCLYNIKKESENIQLFLKL
jgi:hypothetical protein